MHLVVAVQHVSKRYRLYPRPSARLAELLPFSTARHRDFWALRDVSFRVNRGEFFAIVGPNGSGKSTLLAILAGILQPSSGRVHTVGRVAALLELGAGFNPEFTGRENVLLNAEILGLSRLEIERVFPSIAAFAEIGEFLDRPVKEYSSGMYVRLAFATAIHVEPEVLIVDEALAVGDAIFSNRCIRKLEEMKSAGVTTLFVSHDLGLVKRLADRAILMVDGAIREAGSPHDVVNRYIGLVHDRQGSQPRSDGATGSFRHGDGASRITEVRLLNRRGEPSLATLSGEPVTVQFSARFDRDSEHPIAGLLIRNRLGVDVYGTNTRVEQKDLGVFRAGETLVLDFTFDCLLTRGEYTLTVATQNADGSSQDWLDDALSFTVADAKELAGLADLRSSIAWRRA